MKLTILTLLYVVAIENLKMKVILSSKIKAIYNGDINQHNFA